MIKETGRIVKKTPGFLWIETIKKSTCKDCSAKSGCGHSLLSRFEENSVLIKAPIDPKKENQYQINDAIELGIEEDVVVKASLFIYLFPLVLLLVFSGVAHTILNNELITFISGFMGLLAGGLLIQRVSKSHERDKRFHPFVIDEELISICEVITK